MSHKGLDLLSAWRTLLCAAWIRCTASMWRSHVYIGQHQMATSARCIIYIAACHAHARGCNEPSMHNGSCKLVCSAMQGAPWGSA